MKYFLRLILTLFIMMALIECRIERDLFATIELFELKRTERIYREGKDDMWKCIWVNDKGIEVTTHQVSQPAIRPGIKIPGFIINSNRRL